jgi:hypothetical protein
MQSSINIFSISDNNDVVFVEFPKDLQVTIDMAKEMVAARLHFTQNRKHYLILDMSNIKNITNEAKNYMQMPEGGLKNILGAALIASNPVSVLISNVFVKTPKNFQAKFFQNKKDALDWIYLKKENKTINHWIV